VTLCALSCTGPRSGAAPYTRPDGAREEAVLDDIRRQTEDIIRYYGELNRRALRPARRASPNCWTSPSSSRVRWPGGGAGAHMGARRLSAC